MAAELRLGKVCAVYLIILSSFTTVFYALKNGDLNVFIVTYLCTFSGMGSFRLYSAHDSPCDANTQPYHTGSVAARVNKDNA